MKYIRKQAEIEAIKFRRDCFKEIEDFTDGNAFDFRTAKCIDGKSYCNLCTKTGMVVVTEGQYIIKGFNGDYHVEESDIFENMYEITE